MSVYVTATEWSYVLEFPLDKLDDVASFLETAIREGHVARIPHGNGGVIFVNYGLLTCVMVSPELLPDSSQVILCQAAILPVVPDNLESL
jgi:hypothetical protein